MVLRNELLEQLKKLNTSQFDETMFYFEKHIDRSHISEGSRSEQAMELIKLFEQKGLLEELEKYLNDKHPLDPKKVYGNYGARHYEFDRLPHPTTELIGRKNIIKQLYDCLESPETVVMGIIADGGVGKSVLIYEWLNNFNTQKKSDITHIYAFPFYDSEQNTFSSSDGFFLDTLKFFDIEVQEAFDRKLFTLLFNKFTEHNAILVLDGIETLQNSKGEKQGKFFETAMKDFLLKVLRNSPDKRNRLIVVTSRESISDLENRQGYDSIELEYLHKTDGAKLLREIGVTGEESELTEASNDVSGHCLTLTLLGRLLVNFFDAQIKRRHEIDDFLKNVEDLFKGSLLGDDVKHVEQITKYYEKKIMEDKVELKIFLQMMALFHRPMNNDQRLCLSKNADFAKSVSNLSDKEWHSVYMRLESYGLLIIRNSDKIRIKPREWDCNPLIREYFRKTLAPSDRYQAHKVLFEFFKKEAPDKPRNLQELINLYRAVHHGCSARMYKNALKLYRERIMQGEGAYSTNQLGLFSEEVAALGRFFEKDPETETTVDNLFKESDRAWLRARIAFCYTLLGRLDEAMEKRGEELKSCIKHKEWCNASSAYGYISELYVFMGDLLKAEKAAKKAIEFADKCNSLYEKLRSKCRLATVYHLKEDLKTSLNLFQEAEKIQQEFEPQNPRLYSDHGFRYRLLLLDKGEYGKILPRARQARDINKKIETPWNLAIGLDYLIKACAYSEKELYDHATRNFDMAYDELERSRSILYLPEFYLAKANFNNKQKLIKPALNNAENALSIAEQYEMLLYQVDAKLVIAQIYIDSQQITEASKSVEEAKSLVKDYPYSLYSLRTSEIKMLEAQIAFSNKDYDNAKKLLDEADSRIKETGHNRLRKKMNKLAPCGRTFRSFNSPGLLT
ncbi:MAG TPA: hypothetical protein VJL89_03475 [Thermodesulfovibrionia bacterium]|nr:hypothetical protein [Thermodesulfovibrionia bacterium]